MRPSKSRSRGKGNRNRSPSNNINRVFDSSGPEGKVRGTPQQIIDKYGQLARDASLANDRVASENFQQHAEHYARLLSEAQRDMDAKRQQTQGNQQGNQNNNGGQNNDGQQANAGGQNNGQQGGQNNGQQGGQNNGQQGGQNNVQQGGQNNDQQGGKPTRSDRDAQRRQEKRQKDTAADPGSADQPDVIEGDSTADQDSGLVETPEEKPKKKRAPRKPKAEKAPKDDSDQIEAPLGDGDGTTEAAE